MRPAGRESEFNALRRADNKYGAYTAKRWGHQEGPHSTFETEGWGIALSLWNSQFGHTDFMQSVKIKKKKKEKKWQDGSLPMYPGCSWMFNGTDRCLLGPTGNNKYVLICLSRTWSWPTSRHLFLITRVPVPFGLRVWRHPKGTGLHSVTWLVPSSPDSREWCRHVSAVTQSL